MISTQVVAHLRGRATEYAPFAPLREGEDYAAYPPRRRSQAKPGPRRLRGLADPRLASALAAALPRSFSFFGRRRLRGIIRVPAAASPRPASAEYPRRYLARMATVGEWVEGELELHAAARVFNLNVWLFGYDERHDRVIRTPTPDAGTRDVRVAHYHDVHYRAVERSAEAGTRPG